MGKYSCFKEKGPTCIKFSKKIRDTMNQTTHSNDNRVVIVLFDM